jgi:hypothetical protein
MNRKLLLLGFIAGIASGVILTSLLLSQKVMADKSYPKFNVTNRITGPWPDSLDAVLAAPGQHKVVFENDKIRILEITGAPYVSEPMHTHRWPGIMWSANQEFAKAKLVYYHYGFDSLKQIYFVKDSFFEHGPPPNKGFPISPEGPHSVKNLSNIEILAYRVEFKN